MFSLTVRRNFMIAHSLPREAFGPAQGLHGATFVAEVTFRRRELNDDAIVLDIGAAGDVIEEVLAGLNYKNLDEHPDFAGKLSTTEALAAVHRRRRRRAGPRRQRTAGNSPDWMSPCAKPPTPGRPTRSTSTPARPQMLPASRLRLLVPGNIRHNSGGNVYNAALARGLADLGAEVEICPLDGGWPGGSAEDRRRWPAFSATAAAGGPAAGYGDPGGQPHCLRRARGDGSGGGRRARRPGSCCTCPCRTIRRESRALARGRRRHLHQRFGRGADRGPARPGQHRGGPSRHGLRPAGGRQPGRRLRRRRTSSPWPRCCRTRTRRSCLTRSPSSRICRGRRPSSARTPPTPTTPRGSGTPCTVWAWRAGSAPRRAPGQALEAEWSAADLSLLISRAEATAWWSSNPWPAAFRWWSATARAPWRHWRRHRRAAGGGRCRTATRLRPGLPGAAVGLGTDPAPLADLLRHWLTDPALGHAGGTRPGPRGTGCPAGTPRPGPCWNRGSDGRPNWQARVDTAARRSCWRMSP